MASPLQLRWMTVALRTAGLSILAGAAWALYTHGVSPREVIDDVAMAAFGVAVCLVAHKPNQSWALFAFGLVATAAVIIAGDLPWPYRVAAVLCLVIFSLVLWETYQCHVGCRRVASPEVQRIALRAKTQYGVSLDELSRLSPVMLVFLRHTGCPFCRQTLAELAERRKQVEALGVRIALVLMAPEREAHGFLSRYGLEDLHRVIDGRQNIYRAFGLQRGGVLSIVGPNLWAAGLLNMVRHGAALPLEQDGFQMPGVFLIFHGEVLTSYRHQAPSDRPDFLAIARSDSAELSRS